MIQTLSKFTSESLFDATSAFLTKLNVEFDRETAEPINVSALYDDAPMPQYLKDALECIDKTYFIGVVNDLSLSGGKSQVSYGDIISTIQHGGKYDGMFVFACDANPDAILTRTRVAALTRALNKKSVANPVILIIRQGTLLTLSTCERMNYSQEWRKTNGEKLGKVSILRNVECKNDNTHHTHPGHIQILDSLKDKRSETFEELYNHWMKVFSSELLTDKFYKELFNWYSWAVQEIKFPNNLRPKNNDAESNNDAKFNHEACIRLITRLIFVWFLKQKHLIPEEFFDEKYIRENLIKNFDPEGDLGLNYNTKESKYYRLILQNLFFATLNCPIVEEGRKNATNRRFSNNSNNLMHYKSEFMEGGDNKYLELANLCVPFLNGGLFDCLDKNYYFYDGFSERKDSLGKLYLPDYLFFSEGKGLINLLKKYHFTIEENTPYDQEVSLDPELLGKVFEELLGSYTDDGQTKRKKTGSYYTPREIVRYMVNESLVAHLKRMCGDDLEQQYRHLLSYTDEEVLLTDDQRKNIMQAIYNCKVLDPACGSGAFPMGILHQMVHLLKRIDPNNVMWNQMMVNIAIEDARKELEKVNCIYEADRTKIEANRDARLEDIKNAFNSNVNDPDYARKLYLIENCIYGVDIQSIATQISKLRFFISLVVEQTPTSNAKDNFGIRPLPNLESKFVSANTLISMDRTQNLFSSNDEIRNYQDQLQEMNHRYFRTKNNSEKKELQDTMASTRMRMAQAMQNLEFIGDKGYQQLQWDMFDQNASASFFDAEWMFGIKDGFDIVIGNPPYVSYYSRQSVNVESQMLETIKNDISYIKDKKKKGRFHSVQFFIYKALNVINKNGICNFIIDFSFFEKPFADIRRYILSKYHIKEIVTGLTAFEKVSSGQLIIAMDLFQNESTIWKEDIDGNCQLMDMRQFLKDKDCNIQKPSLNADFLKKIEERSYSLMEIAEVRTGVNIGGVKEYFLCDDKNYPPFVSGGDNIHLYHINYPTHLQVKREETNFKFDKSVEKNIWVNKIGTPSIGENNERFIRPKLIIRQSDVRITSAIDIDKQYHCGYSLFTVNIPCDNIDKLYCLLGIINSKLITFYMLNKGWIKIAPGKTPQIRVDDVKKIPITTEFVKQMSAELGKISELAKNIVQNKSSDKSYDTSILEQEIDNYIYSLYGLTEEEIMTIEDSVRN